MQILRKLQKRTSQWWQLIPELCQVIGVWLSKRERSSVVLATKLGQYSRYSSM